MLVFAGFFIAYGFVLYWPLHNEHVALEKTIKVLSKCQQKADDARETKAQIEGLNKQLEELQKTLKAQEPIMTAVSEATGMSRQKLIEQGAALKTIVQNTALGNKNLGELLKMFATQPVANNDCNKETAITRSKARWASSCVCHPSPSLRSPASRSRLTAPSNECFVN